MMMYDVVWIHVQPAHNGSAWSKQIQVLGLVLAESRKMKGLHTFALFDPPKWLIYTPED